MATYDFTNSWDIGTYIKDGNLEKISSSKKLKELLTSDLSD